MKKVLGALLLFAVLGLNTVILANEPINEDPGRVECNTQYDSGTTTFVYCWDCSSQTGKPGGSLDHCRH